MVAFPQMAYTDDVYHTTGLEVLPPATGQQAGIVGVQAGWAPWIVEDPRALGTPNASIEPIAIKFPPVPVGPPVQSAPGSTNPSGTATTNTPVTGVAWPTRQTNRWGGVIRPVQTQQQVVQQAQQQQAMQALTPTQTLNLAGTVAGIPVWAIGAVAVVGVLFFFGGKK